MKRLLHLDMTKRSFYLAVIPIPRKVVFQPGYLQASDERTPVKKSLGSYNSSQSPVPCSVERYGRWEHSLGFTENAKLWPGMMRTGRKRCDKHTSTTKSGLPPFRIRNSCHSRGVRWFLPVKDLTLHSMVITPHGFHLKPLFREKNNAIMAT